MDKISPFLEKYTNANDAKFLIHGFQHGFPLGYAGPRIYRDSKNLKSVIDNIDIAKQKIYDEIDAGRMSGPYATRPISNLRCSPIGLVPKKSGGFRLITHMSHPASDSVNDYIDPMLTSVKYSDFDNAVKMIKRLGKGTLMGKMDLKNAFRILPCYPGDFDLLGIMLDGQYYIDKCMPMGCSISCSTFEKFSSFLNWEIKRRSGYNDIDHYLDDFIFMSVANSDICKLSMLQFEAMCTEFGVPIACDKTVGPVTCLLYLGLELDSISMEIRVPRDKVINLLHQINDALLLRKITLQQLQSLTGSLAFCAKAMPSARAFIRRLYSAMSQAKKPYHKIRLSNGLKSDLNMWKTFLTNYNGTSVMLDTEWKSNSDIQLFTDSAGQSNLGCGIYFNGRWAFMQWPQQWKDTDILKDITFLEIIPIALACFLWSEHFRSMRIQFSCDNMAVVHILNSKSSKSNRVMALVRQIVLWSLKFDFQLNAVHISGVNNNIVDSISRMQWKTFRMLAPEAEVHPTPIPRDFMTYLPMK
jgi:hypothetical protein